MSKERAAEAVEKSKDYKEIMTALAAEQEASQSDLQPPNINPNPKPDGQVVVPSTAYSQYNMV
tara:strand:+ start:1338 stop:1526 length:189 start_codon:yes stop_codon:yes gene_type:complete